MRPTDPLDAVRRRLGDCTRCALHAGRNTIVFGEGSPEAQVVFVGEGPGEQEDRTGKQQETYVSYRDVRDNEAYTALVRGRLNNFQTQNEYLPRLEHRLSGEPVDTGPFGTAYFAS